MAVVMAISAAPASAHVPWPAPPAHRAACSHHTAPGLCRLHWWVRRTWGLQDRRQMHRTRYWWAAERHPRQAPWLERRVTWKARAHYVARLPIPPWPRGWLSDALCVHHYEGAWTANTGNGYYGGMQFDLATWQANGGSGRPDLVSPRRQLQVALTTWEHRDWEPWPVSASLCGLL